jgi:hypothetical protein
VPSWAADVVSGPHGVGCPVEQAVDSAVPVPRTTLLTSAISPDANVRPLPSAYDSVHSSCCGVPTWGPKWSTAKTSSSGNVTKGARNSPSLGPSAPPVRPCQREKGAAVLFARVITPSVVVSTPTSVQYSMRSPCVTKGPDRPAPWSAPSCQTNTAAPSALSPIGVGRLRTDPRTRRPAPPCLDHQPAQRLRREPVRAAPTPVRSERAPARGCPHGNRTAGLDATALDRTRGIWTPARRAASRVARHDLLHGRPSPRRCPDPDRPNDRNRSSGH